MGKNAREEPARDREKENWEVYHHQRRQGVTMAPLKSYESAQMNALTENHKWHTPQQDGLHTAGARLAPHAMKSLVPLQWLVDPTTSRSQYRAHLSGRRNQISRPMNWRGPFL